MIQLRMTLTTLTIITYQLFIATVMLSNKKNLRVTEPVDLLAHVLVDLTWLILARPVPASKLSCRLAGALLIEVRCAYVCGGWSGWVTQNVLSSHPPAGEPWHVLKAMAEQQVQACPIV